MSLTLAITLEHYNKQTSNKGEPMYCPKCKSRLYHNDQEYVKATGVCSYCVTWDATPDKRFMNLWVEYEKAQRKNKKRREK